MPTHLGSGLSKPNIFLRHTCFARRLIKKLAKLVLYQIMPLCNPFDSSCLLLITKLDMSTYKTSTYKTSTYNDTSTYNTPMYNTSTFTLPSLFTFSTIELALQWFVVLQWSVVAIGTAGILSNVYSLYHNFRRGKGFPRQLYIVLHFIDLSVCVIGVLHMCQLIHYGRTYEYLFDFKGNSWVFVSLYFLGNQTSGIWT